MSGRRMSVAAKSTRRISPPDKPDSFRSPGGTPTATDTFFIGGWHEGIIYHINSAGMVLDSVYVAMTIAGLAYNPDTQHLFVIENGFANDAIYVLDASNQYSLVGQFQIPFGAYSGAGLEIDCDGNLWAVEQKTGTVYQLESG